MRPRMPVSSRRSRPATISVSSASGRSRHLGMPRRRFLSRPRAAATAALTSTTLRISPRPGQRHTPSRSSRTSPLRARASRPPRPGAASSTAAAPACPHRTSPVRIKSALVLTGDPVHNGGTAEVNPLREGGGRIALVRADQPLAFASPTSLSFGLLKPAATAQRTVSLADAGGGAGVWNVTTSIAGAPLSLPAQATVPGPLPVRAVVPRNAREGEVTGFVILSREGIRRRIPFWLRVERPRLRLDRQVPLGRPGPYAANTSRGAARVSSYRYPDVLPGHAAFPVRLSGREIVYRVRIRRRIANFGVAVIARDRGVGVEPRVVRSGDENRLAGYSALP